ncbi:hypothetical protein ADUPG1_013208, partial [Aduncisulcus paluster]
MYMEYEKIWSDMAKKAHKDLKKPSVITRSQLYRFQVEAREKLEQEADRRKTSDWVSSLRGVDSKYVQIGGITSGLFLEIRPKTKKKTERILNRGGLSTIADDISSSGVSKKLLSTIGGKDIFDSLDLLDLCIKGESVDVECGLLTKTVKKLRKEKEADAKRRAKKKAKSVSFAIKPKPSGTARLFASDSKDQLDTSCKIHELKLKNQQQRQHLENKLYSLPKYVRHVQNHPPAPSVYSKDPTFPLLLLHTPYNPYIHLSCCEGEKTSVGVLLENVGNCAVPFKIILGLNGPHGIETHIVSSEHLMSPSSVADCVSVTPTHGCLLPQTHTYIIVTLNGSYIGRSVCMIGVKTEFGCVEVVRQGEDSSREPSPSKPREKTDNPLKQIQGTRGAKMGVLKPIGAESFDTALLSSNPQSSDPSDDEILISRGISCKIPKGGIVEVFKGKYSHSERYNAFKTHSVPQFVEKLHSISSSGAVDSSIKLDPFGVFSSFSVEAVVTPKPPLFSALSAGVSSSLAKFEDMLPSLDVEDVLTSSCVPCLQSLDPKYAVCIEELKLDAEKEKERLAQAKLKEERAHKKRESVEWMRIMSPQQK